MLAKYPLAEVPPARAAARPRKRKASEPVVLPGAEVAELIHLARAVLLKSPEDLAAVAQASPAMPADWIKAFQAEKRRADAEAHFWSAAIAYLMTTAPAATANDE